MSKKMPQNTIPLGWRLPEEAAATMGFQIDHQPARRRTALVRYSGEGHITTIAPTGSGKGRGCIIPTLLTCRSNVIVIDPKGENYQVTARRRREFGQRVVVLDPFRIVTEEPDTFNPLDFVRRTPGLFEPDIETIGELLVGDLPERLPDPFWEHTARSFLNGMLADIVSDEADAEACHLGTLRARLSAPDVACDIAGRLDNELVRNQLAVEELQMFLGHEGQKVRPSVLSTAQQHVRILSSDAVRASVARSTFALDDVIGAQPLSIFICIPPERLTSHAQLLRLWVGVLMAAITRRTEIPKRRTLFILDEAAQLGELRALRQAVTLLRGYGVQVHTLWQDLSQLQRLYSDWPTILNNSAIKQCFGVTTRGAAHTLADVLGYDDPQRLLDLAPHEQVLSMPGVPTGVLRRLDYLRDRVFNGLFDDNPRYGSHGL